MKRALHIVLVSIGIWSNAGACDAGLSSSAQVWADHFSQLRSTPGHFSGGAWNAAVDAWGGAKHEAMRRLACDAVEQGATLESLRERMGPADEVVACPSKRCEDLYRQARWDGGAVPEAPALWLYDWRGRHDRLVFSTDHARVHGAGWLHAHE